MTEARKGILKSMLRNIIASFLLLILSSSQWSQQVKSEIEADSQTKSKQMGRVSSAKDLFLSGLAESGQTRNNAFAFSLELFRPNQKPSICSTDTEFFGGDGIRIKFNPNFDGYAYIYMSKGASGKRAVLYPQGKASNRIFAGKQTYCPLQGLLRFDKTPGTEQIYFILSRKPIDPEKTMEEMTAVPLSKGLARSEARLSNLLIQKENNANKEETFVVKTNSEELIFTELSLRHSSRAMEPVPVVVPVSPGTVSVPTKADGNTVSSSATSIDSAASNNSAPEKSRISENLQAKLSSEISNSVGTSELNRPLTDKWAMILALSKYADPSMNLKAPRKDAENFAKFLLTDAGFSPTHIMKLYDTEARKINVINALEQLGQKVRPDDLVVFYINCHGSCTTKQGGNYLLLFDYAGENSLDHQLLMQELSDLIKSRIKSNRLVLIVQACHSGFVKGARAPSPQGISHDLIGAGRIIATACAGEESSWVYKRGGIFTMNLIPNLRKYSKLKEALEQTRLDVISQTERETETKQMHPVVNYQYWLGDDAVLTATPSSPVP